MVILAMLLICYAGAEDTIGAIVGSIAEAAFGIPHEIYSTALHYLPEEMNLVIGKYFEKLNII